MSREARLLLIWLAVIPLGLRAQGFAEICESLLRMSPYASTARVDVFPPGSSESIRYDLRLFSSESADTALSPSAYLIETVETDGKPSDSFSAFAEGCFWHWDGQRLAERSAADSSLNPATAHGAQFAELLPQFILERLLSFDTADIEIEQDGPERLTIKAAERYAGETVATYSLTLSLPSLTPLSAQRVTGIGTPAETGITAVYHPSSERPLPVTAQFISARHADVITRFGQGNRTPKSFIGFPFPSLTLPNTSGGRYTFRPGHETIAILIDDIGNPGAIEEYTRLLRPMMSRPDFPPVDIVYILLSRYADAIPASESPSGRETILLGGSAMARELGADTESLPIAIAINSDGRVASITSLTAADPIPAIESIIKSF